MNKSRFIYSQIIAVLKQAEAGTPVPELCREHGISSATFYEASFDLSNIVGPTRGMIAIADKFRSPPHFGRISKLRESVVSSE